MYIIYAYIDKNVCVNNMSCENIYALILFYFCQNVKFSLHLKTIVFGPLCIQTISPYVCINMY